MSRPVEDVTLDFRYLVTQPDLNAHGTLHGGILMKWADESAGMHARKVSGYVCVTRFIDKINFVSTSGLGTIVRIESKITKVGKTSLTFQIRAVNDISQDLIATIDELVFVSIHGLQKPIRHGLHLVS